MASGTVKETITEGSYVKLVVKYGFIKLIDQTLDLCEQIKNVDLECPVEKGKLSIVKEVELPKEIPPVRLHCILGVGPTLLTLCAGKIRCDRRRVQERRRAYHLPDGHRPLWKEAFLRPLTACF